MSAAAPALLLLTFPAALLWAAATDLRRYIIPNAASIVLVVGFFAAFFASGLPLEALRGHLIVGGCALAAGFLLFALKLWGGGDGKLVAAAALWFQPDAAMLFALSITLIGGGIALAGIAVARLRFVLWRIPALRAIDLETLGAKVPYGVAIAAGSLFAAQESDLVRALLRAL